MNLNRSFSFFFFSIVITKPSAIDISTIVFLYFCIFVNIDLIFHVALSFLKMYYLPLRGVACTFFKTHIRRPKQAQKMQISFVKFVYY